MKFESENKGLKVIQMAQAAIDNTQNLLNLMAKKYGPSGYNKTLPSNLPTAIGHTLFYGPGGVGKTVSVEKAAKLMGCSEDDGTFIRLSSDSFNNAKEFVDILQDHLTWDGYLCDQGKINHENCKGCKIIDPIHPRGPIKQTAVFIDEIHAIDKTTQIGLLLILLDFRYQFKDETGRRDVYFPKFTLFGATTDPGLLSKPLRTRFKNRVSISYYSDEQMTNIVKKVTSDRGWKIEDKGAEILARCSQGIPREAINHLDGLYSCWCFFRKQDEEREKLGFKKVLSEKDNNILSTEMVIKYIEIKEYVKDGLSYDQIRLLNYLNRRTETGKYVTAGIKKILDAMGWDEQQYADEVEPRLVARGFLDTTRSRRITQDGVKYLEQVTTEYPEIIA